MSLLSKLRRASHKEESDQETLDRVEWSLRNTAISGTPVKLTWGDRVQSQPVRCSYCCGPWKEDERGCCVRCGACGVTG